jgi:glucose-6-phosphate 1-dehydrogenase
MPRNRQGSSRRGKPGDPCVLVIFGASGDLGKRKLFPALLNLRRSGLLRDELVVLGVATSEMTSEAFRERLTGELADFAAQEVASGGWAWLRDRIHYLPGNFRSPELYAKLKQRLPELDREGQAQGNVLFYLATPPDFFGEIAERLGAAGLLAQADGWRRVIIEKPFGNSYESARELNARLQKVLAEEQIYRIDHYLGKETVQNLLVFRFANGIFEPIWNRRYIDCVQITVAETVGVEQRGRYYDQAGALRDMVPNHLFQLLALTAMEPPSSFDAEAVRDEKAKLLRAIQPPTPEQVLSRTVRGQYDASADPARPSQAYRSESRVDPRSNIETYAALKLEIDNWRWADVPFYLRTGKRMARQHTDVTILFRRPPHRLFRGTDVADFAANVLVLHLQPDEGISLGIQAKVPGPVIKSSNVEMAFSYAEHFGSTPSTGYETLLYDCMCGDATLFQRADSVEDGWAIVEPVLDVWKALPARSFPNYPAFSWGPPEADELLARDGRAWHATRE